MGLLTGLISGNWKIGRSNQIRPARLDFTTHTLQTIEYEHHEIHSGSMFFVMYSVTSVGAMTTPDDTITLTWTTGNTTGKYSHFEFVAEGPSGGRVRLIEAPSGGAASPTGQITILNHRLASTSASEWASTVAVNQVDYDATLATGGTTLWDSYIAGATTGQTGSGLHAKRDELILKANTKYQLSLYSTATTAGYLYLNWYEHTDKD
jgi:hypothetical protein